MILNLPKNDNNPKGFMKELFSNDPTSGHLSPMASLYLWLKNLSLTTFAYPCLFCWIIEIEDLAKLVTAYQQRKFDEDVSYLENELGGMITI